MVKSSILALWVILALAFYTDGQTSHPQLAETRVTARFHSEPLHFVLEYLMTKYDIPIGFEESVFDRGHNDFDFETNLPVEGSQTWETSDRNVKVVITAHRTIKTTAHYVTLDCVNERLSVVLDSLVRQMNNYKWEIANGVVDIFPSKGRDAKYEALLKTNIASFSFSKGRTVGSLSKILKSQPELVMFLAKNNLTYRPSHSGIDFVLEAQLERSLAVDMKYQNISFLELLNRITPVKRGGWIIRLSRRYKSATTEFIDIDI